MLFKTVKYGHVKVPIYKSTVHGKTRYQIVWGSGGDRKIKQRTSEKDAIELADRMAKDLSMNGQANSHIVSAEGARLLGRLKRLAGGDIGAFISELEAGSKLLGGASWLEVARFWQDAAPENYEERSVQEVFDEYMPLFDDRPQKARSGVRSKVSKFVDAFGGRRISGITPKEIEKWFHQLPGSKTYANNILAEVITFFRKAQVWGYLPDKTVAPSRVAKHRTERKEPGIFTVQQAKDILKSVREDCVPYVAIGLFAGLRPFELAYPGEGNCLLWQDINFDKGYIHVRPSVDGKNQVARYVDLPENLAAWLQPHRKGSGKVAYTRASALVSKDLRDKGIVEEWEADVMRHSFCSYLLAKTRDMALVSDQAGNSPEMIKKHYKKPLTKTEGESWFKILPDNTLG